VWATQLGGVNYVWAVGDNGTLLYCHGTGAGGCTDSTSTWTQVTNPAPNNQTLNAISGAIDGTNVSIMAVGNVANGTTLDNIVNYSAPTATPGSGTWGKADQAGGPTGKSLSGVFVTDETGTPYVWAVGATSTILSCNATCTTASTGTWTSPGSVPQANIQLNAVGGSGGAPSASQPLWIVGAAQGTAQTMWESTNGTSWTSQNQTITGGGTTALNAVAVATGGGASYMWGAGGSTTSKQISWYWCSTGTTSPCQQLWTGTNYPGTVPSSPVTIRGASAVSSPYVGAFVVGEQTGTPYGTVFEFTAPVNANQPSVISSGGQVFNGSLVQNWGPHFQFGGTFTQYATSGCTSGSPPAYINMTSGNGNYLCTSSVPASVQSVINVQGATGMPQLPSGTAYTNLLTKSTSCNVTVTGQGLNGTQTLCRGELSTPISCTGGVKAQVFAPGLYNGTPPDFAESGVAFTYMEPGIYYFLNTPRMWIPALRSTGTSWVIAGPPSPQDTPTFWNSSNPCWSTFTQSGGAGYNYYEPGKGTSSDTGTGAEWILGGSSWVDAHNGIVEIFTRQCATANPTCAQEGSQGVSVREVPPCSTAITGTGQNYSTCQTGWSSASPNIAYTNVQTMIPPAPGQSSPGQLFQLDDSFTPGGSIHGGIYAPDANVQLYSIPPSGAFAGQTSLSQTAWVVAGALELGDETSTTPANYISGGSVNQTTVRIVSTANSIDTVVKPVSEEAIVQLNTVNGIWYVTKIYSWRQCDRNAGC